MIYEKGFVRFYNILVSKCIFDEFATGRIHFVFGFMGYIPASQFL